MGLDDTTRLLNVLPLHHTDGLTQGLSLVGWMVLTVAGYWLLPDRLRDAWLSGVTLAFLIMHAPLSAAILVGFALATRPPLLAG